MSRRVVFLTGAAVALSGVMLMAAEEPRPPAQAFYLDHYDVSLPLRDLTPRPPSKGKHEAPSVRMIHPPRAVGSFTDAALQAPFAGAGREPLVATTPGLNFDGVGVGFPGFAPDAAPPDTNGSVGNTQYVQWVNESFAVFNKTTGAIIQGPTTGDTLWQGFGGPCEFNNDGDPVAIYDKAANRWVMSQFAVGQGSPYLQCIAVSTTSDATGSYRRFSYQFTDFNDYPKFGVWPDGYYVSFNMFIGGQLFAGPRACAIDRNQMITPAGVPGPIVCFQLGTTFGGLLPADLDGTTPPPAGSPNYFVAYDFNTLNRLQLWKFKVDFVSPGNSTFVGPTFIPVTAFAEACGGGACVRQSGTTQRLASLGDRMMYRLAYRNFGTHESLLANHSVTVSSRTGVRWYELRNPNGTPVVFQSGTYSPNSQYRWMGSIASDKSGNIALGYSVSASNLFPSLRYTGRTPSDPLGTLQAETSIMAGGGSQGLGLNRWGDYSSMSLDPVDDCTFFFTSEYLKSSGTFNWSTRIASFKFPGCGGAATPDFTIGASPSSVSVVQGASNNTTVTLTSLNGFGAATTLSTTGLPSGVSAAFSPNPATPPANGSVNSTLTFTASGAAATGTFNVTVTGTSGATIHSTTVALTVTPAAAPNFTIGASPTSVSVVQGANGSTTVTLTSQNGFNSATTLSATGLPSGVTAAFSPNPATPPANGSVNSTLTFTASAAATTGTVTVTVTGTSGALIRSTTVSLTVTAGATPDFTLSLTPTTRTVVRPGTTTYTVNINRLNGFASGVTFSVSPAGGTFSPNPATGTSSTLTVPVAAGTPPGTYNFTVTGTGGGLTRTTSGQLVVQ